MDGDETFRGLRGFCPLVDKLEASDISDISDIAVLNLILFFFLLRPVYWSLSSIVQCGWRECRRVYNYYTIICG